MIVVLRSYSKYNRTHYLRLPWKPYTAAYGEFISRFHEPLRVLSERIEQQWVGRGIDIAILRNRSS